MMKKKKPMIKFEQINQEEDLQKNLNCEIAVAIIIPKIMKMRV